MLSILKIKSNSLIGNYETKGGKKWVSKLADRIVNV